MPRFLIRSSYPEKLFARQRLHGSVRQPTLAAKALLIDFGGALKSTSCRPTDTGTLRSTPANQPPLTGSRRVIGLRALVRVKISGDLPFIPSC